jgi:hypothetical protein
VGERPRQDLAGRGFPTVGASYGRAGRGRGGRGAWSISCTRGGHRPPPAAVPPLSGRPGAAGSGDPPCPGRTAGLTVTRLANCADVISFVGIDYQCGRGWVGVAVQGRQGHPGYARSGTTEPASSARSPTPRDARAARTQLTVLSPGYQNSPGARVPELDSTESPATASPDRPYRKGSGIPGAARRGCDLAPSSWYGFDRLNAAKSRALRHLQAYRHARQYLSLDRITCPACHA